MLRNIIIPASTLVVGTFLRPWVALIFGGRIRREDAELARRRLYDAETFFLNAAACVPSESLLNADGSGLDYASLMNSMRTILARCHDRKFRNALRNVIEVTPTFGDWPPRKSTGVFVEGQQIFGFMLNIQDATESQKRLTFEAVEFGRVNVAAALKRLDQLERRLTFWEGRLA